MASQYPLHREADVVLRDGSTVRIRPARPDDERHLLAFFRALSPESRTFRFFTPAADLASAASRESQVDYDDIFALVALVGSSGRVVGNAAYYRLSDDRAEVAFAVADEYQGRGLGTILLGHLAEVAAANGVGVFEAEVMPENLRMLDVFRGSGFPIEVRSRPGHLHVTFPASLTLEAVERFERREQTAAVNAVKAFLEPRAVAVIGASRRRGTIGGELFHNLLTGGFEGPVYPVNANAEVVQSVPAYPTVEAIPGPVDLALIAVPTSQVVSVAEQCARKRVRALLVVSEGFAEAGAEGSTLQEELVRVCRLNGMRLIGPASLGVVNTASETRLNAVFAAPMPRPGAMALAAQSGAVGVAAVAYASSRGLGISSFISMGNKADLSGNDLLQYWESDPRTRVIALYLESFGNPRKFARIARRIGRSKPIAVVKSGRSIAAAPTLSTRLARLLSASDVTVDALFRQAGVIRTDTLDELLNVAPLLAHQPIPRGRGVAIVTNVRSPAALCLDACHARGLRIAALGDETLVRLRERLPGMAGSTNPIVLPHSALAEHYHTAIELAALDPGVNAIIVIHVPRLSGRGDEVVQAIVDAGHALELELPVLAVLMTTHGLPNLVTASSPPVPTYPFPEAAAIALAHAVRYGEWRQRAFDLPPQLDDVERDAAAALVASALGRGGGWLEPAERQKLLSFFGLSISIDSWQSTRTPDEAGVLAARLGGDVALKVVGPAGIESTRMRLWLQGQAAVRRAAEEMAAELSGGGPETRFFVREIPADGVQISMSVFHDSHFGPVIACSAGTPFIGLPGDVSVGLAPLTRADARQMIERLRTYPLLSDRLTGSTIDSAAIEDLLLRLSALAEGTPQVAELDCGPVLVVEGGVEILDASICLKAIEPPKPLGARG